MTLELLHPDASFSVLFFLSEQRPADRKKRAEKERPKVGKIAETVR
jgi:hypothetical protein